MGVEDTNYEYYSLRQLPMIAGILAPICILLSIPPLTGDWIINPNDQDIKYKLKSEFRPNINILSLLFTGVFFLFLAQISLILRFFERRIVLNTWICIIGYFLNTLLTLSSIIYFTLNHQIPSANILSDEYYATYASISLSFISFLVLITDYFKHNKLKGKGGGLSRNQRILILVFILVTIWIVIGALIMCNFQKWTFVRGVYFSLVTITTIGFGDYVPKSPAARGFNIFYASIGIILIGMLIAFIHSVIIDYFEAVYIQQVSKIRAIGLENFYTLTIQKFSKNSKQGESGEESKKVKKVTTIQNLEDQEKELRKSQFSQFLKQLHFSIIALLLFWFLGAAIFCWLEGWNYFTGLYFCFISFTTIGYGDITVKPVNSIIIFCIYSLLGLPTMAYFISVSIELFSTLIETNSDKIERKRKLKFRKSVNRRVSVALSINADAEQDLELVKALEINTGNKQRDLLNKLLTMTEFYNSGLSDYFSLSKEEIKLARGDQSKLQVKKIDKYEVIFQQLIDLFNESRIDESLENSTELC